MNSGKQISGDIAVWILSFCICTYIPGASGGELVYTPVNPSFGGNPLNGSVLLNSAQAQNKTKDPSASSLSSSAQKTALDQFNDALQRAVLSRLTSAVNSKLFDANGKLIPGSSVETADFTIEIADYGNSQVKIITTDKLTKKYTEFVIDQSLAGTTQ